MIVDVDGELSSTRTVRSREHEYVVDSKDLRLMNDHVRDAERQNAPLHANVTIAFGVLIASGVDQPCADIWHSRFNGWSAIAAVSACALLALRYRPSQ